VEEAPYSCLHTASDKFHIGCCASHSPTSGCNPCAHTAGCQCSHKVTRGCSSCPPRGISWQHRAHDGKVAKQTTCTFNSYTKQCLVSVDGWRSIGCITSTHHPQFTTICLEVRCHLSATTGALQRSRTATAAYEQLIDTSCMHRLPYLHCPDSSCLLLTGGAASLCCCRLMVDLMSTTACCWPGTVSESFAIKGVCSVQSSCWSSSECPDAEVSCSAEGAMIAVSGVIFPAQTTVLDVKRMSDRQGTQQQLRSCGQISHTSHQLGVQRTWVV